jgi:two-component system, NtrC family, sensor kinase
MPPVGETSRRTALVAFLCATVALALVSFERKVQSFAVAISVREGAGSLIVGADAPAGLHPGDRIVAIDGLPVAALPDPARALSRPPFPHRVAVVRGSEISTAVVPRPPAHVDYRYLFLALVGSLYLLIGLATLWRDGSMASTLFAAFCVASFGIDLLTPSGPIDGFWKTVWMAEDVLRAFAPALLLHLFLVFPRRTAAARWAAWLYVAPALWIGAEAWMSLPAAGIPARRLPFAVELSERFWIAILVVYGAAAIVRIGTAARDAEHPEAQRQARWISLGCAFGLTPFLVLYALPRLFGASADWSAVAGLAPLVLVPLGFAWAILRFRLWDVDVFAREAAATAAAVFLGAAAFVLVHMFVDRLLVGLAAAAKSFLAFGSGLFLASLLVPVRRRISGALERFQYGETFRARRALLEMAREWRGIRDSSRLAEAVESRVASALEVAPCELWTPDRLPPGVAWSAIEERLADADVLRVRSATFPSGEDFAFVRLLDDGYRHLFALRPGGRLRGALAVGSKEGGIPLSGEDVALVSTVMTQAALAFENADLYHALERRMEEIRTLQEFQDGVIRSSSAGIVVVDANDRVRSANPAFERLAGEPESALLGRAFAQILPGAPPELLRSASEEQVVECPSSTGDPRLLRVSISPFVGSPSSRVVLVEDETERARQERGRSEKERLASLGILAAGVAHEVNTPLAGISSYAQMLLADTDRADPRYDILKKMERQTFRASRLVRDLLEFARGRHGAPEPIDLSRVVRESIDAAEPALAERRIRVRTEGVDLPRPAVGSAREIEQVIVNLLLNARDASPEGGELEVEVTQEADAHVVCVADRGRGLSEEARRRAFEPFYTTRSSGGTGLGLFLAREIVSRHGGTIALDPRPGGGACAVMTLPRG